MNQHWLLSETSESIIRLPHQGIGHRSTRTRLHNDLLFGKDVTYLFRDKETVVRIQKPCRCRGGKVDSHESDPATSSSHPLLMHTAPPLRSHRI